MKRTEEELKKIVIPPSEMTTDEKEVFDSWKKKEYLSDRQLSVLNHLRRPRPPKVARADCSLCGIDYPITHLAKNSGNVCDSCMRERGW